MYVYSISLSLSLSVSLFIVSPNLVSGFANGVWTRSERRSTLRLSLEPLDARYSLGLEALFRLAREKGIYASDAIHGNAYTLDARP